jgi:hypothetical protein
MRISIQGHFFKTNPDLNIPLYPDVTDTEKDLDGTIELAAVSGRLPLLELVKDVTEFFLVVEALLPSRSAF